MSATTVQQAGRELAARPGDAGASRQQVSALVPFVLGVTGHRHLRPEDLRALRERVGEIFRRLRRDYPHTPLVLLSPLNEGADRFVAEVALEQGVQLLAVLAWPEGVCDERLHRSGERSEFDGLVAQAAQVIRLPLIDGTTAAELEQDEPCRQRHYEQVGAYIARHSQMLIALWDGIDAPESGTASVIRWQREGKTAPFAPVIGLLDEVENGPVYHIVTPRRDRPMPEEALTPRTLPPSGYENAEDAERDQRRILRNIDRFNRDAGRVEQRHPEQIAAGQSYVLPEAERGRLSPPLVRLLHYYGLADAASLRFQRITLRTLWALFVGVFVAVVCLKSYAHLWETRWLLLGYLGILGAAAAWYATARRLNFQDRYIDYRALAESLRVQFFWRLALLDDSAADHYLRHVRSDLDWIRQAARACLLTAGGHNSCMTGVGKDEHACGM